MNMIRQSASSTEEALDCMRCLLDGGADPLAGYYPPLCAALDECDVVSGLIKFEAHIWT